MFAVPSPGSLSSSHPLDPLLVSAHPLPSLSNFKDKQKQFRDRAGSGEYKDILVGDDQVVQVRTGEESENHVAALTSVFIHSDLLLGP